MAQLPDSIEDQLNIIAEVTRRTDQGWGHDEAIYNALSEHTLDKGTSHVNVQLETNGINPHYGRTHAIRRKLSANRLKCAYAASEPVFYGSGDLRPGADATEKEEKGGEAVIDDSAVFDQDAKEQRQRKRPHGTRICGGASSFKGTLRQQNQQAELVTLLCDPDNLTNIETTIVRGMKRLDDIAPSLRTSPETVKKRLVTDTFDHCMKDAVMKSRKKMEPSRASVCFSWFLKLYEQEANTKEAATEIIDIILNDGRNQSINTDVTRIVLKNFAHAAASDEVPSLVALMSIQHMVWENAGLASDAAITYGGCMHLAGEFFRFCEYFYQADSEYYKYGITSDIRGAVCGFLKAISEGLTIGSDEKIVKVKPHPFFTDNIEINGKSISCPFFQIASRSGRQSNGSEVPAPSVFRTNFAEFESLITQMEADGLCFPLFVLSDYIPAQRDNCGDD